MLGIHIGSKVRARKIQFNEVGAVAVVNDHIRHEARRDVLLLACRPLGAPPASSDTDLIPVGVVYLELQIERTRLHLLPDILRNGVALLARGIALGSEAVVAAPVDGSKRAVVLPDRSLHDFHMAAAIHPDVFSEVDTERCVATTSEEQVLGIHIGSKVRACKIQFNEVSAVAVVNNHVCHETRRDILLLAGRPLGAPPTGSDTDLIPVGIVYLELQIERTRLHLLPDILRNGVALLTCGIALGSEAVVAAPVDRTERAVVLPDHRLHCLPVTLIGTGLVSQLRHLNGLAVIGME